MTLSSEANAAQITWKQTTALLPDAARLDGPYRYADPLLRQVCLPGRFAPLNLLPEARDAVSRFAADGIVWHAGMGDGPGTHLRSSQIQCVNALAPFRADPEGLRALLTPALPIAEVLPFGAGGFPDDLVVFEWIGLEDYLGESPGRDRRRGANCTAADAAIRYLNLDGQIEIALIEWKYTESYGGGSLPGGTKSATKRRATYLYWWSADGPVRQDVIDYEDLFTEPVYQLFRLQCLAHEMELQHELGAERVRLLVAAPRRNFGYWRVWLPGPVRERGDLETFWRSALRQPDRFVVLDTATLVGDHGRGSENFQIRYAHLTDESAEGTAIASDDAVDADPVAAFLRAAELTSDRVERLTGVGSVLEHICRGDLGEADADLLLLATERLHEIAELSRELNTEELVELDSQLGGQPGPSAAKDGMSGTVPLGNLMERSLDDGTPLSVRPGPALTGMDSHALKVWAQEHGRSVMSHADSARGLPAMVLRFRWNGELAVGVGCDASGEFRIHAITHALAWYRSEAASGPINVFIGLAAPGADVPVPQEQLDALGTVATSWGGDPQIRLWQLANDGEPVEFAARPARFTTATPAHWAQLLANVANAPIAGMAGELATAVHLPSFALYPKLTGMAGHPWQMRLDGLDIGLAGPGSTCLKFGGNLSANGGPQAAWNAVVGQQQRIFAADDIDSLVDLVRDLAEQWTSRTPGAVLQHGQSEHALEAHILSDRLRLRSASGPLRTAVPFRGGMLGAAQFPTLWGNVTAPRRYLDALLVDRQDRPWAVELKDQKTGGGHGAYLRKGITQAVLYRHYIRSTSALDAWFDNHGLDRKNCQAALAFPTATPNAAAQVSGHREIARGFDIEVIEFTRPGD